MLSSSLAVVQVAGHFFRDQFAMKNGKNTNANIINIKWIVNSVVHQNPGKYSKMQKFIDLRAKIQGDPNQNFWF